MRFDIDQDLRDRARHLRASSRRDWYRIEAKAGDPADIYLFDEISWFGVTAKDFVAELKDVESDNITLHLNSPGGDVFDGIAIYQALKAHPADVTVRVEGLAASIASIIAMAGDEIVMAKHSTMMIHDPWGLTIGNAADHEKQAQVLNQLGEESASIYAERGQTVAHWRALMKEETWFTDKGAVDAGLADSIDDGKPADSKAAASFDLTVFAHPPAELVALRDAGGKRDSAQALRDAERALRDAGFSRQEAAKRVARGWPEESDADLPSLESLLESMRALRAS